MSVSPVKRRGEFSLVARLELFASALIHGFPIAFAAGAQDFLTEHYPLAGLPITAKISVIVGSGQA